MSDVVKKRMLLLMPFLLICALLSGIFLPVYSDEIVTKFSIARFFLEEGKMLSFFPQCTTTVGHYVGWVFYPAAILISSVYAQLEPFGIRVSGIALGLIWFSLLAYWCFRQSKEKWLDRVTLIAAFASLGVMPYLWVFSRPEQFMLTPILIFCIAALYLPQQNSIWQQVLVACVVGITASVFFYAHPKSLFFAPFIVIAVWTCVRKYNWIIIAASIAYIVLLCLQVLRDTNLLSSCKDAPGIQSLLAINSLMPADLLRDPFGFIQLAGRNFLEFPNRMLVHLTFNQTSQSGWLPPLTTELFGLDVLNLLIRYTLLGLIIVTHLGAIGLGCLCLMRRQITPPLLLAALLAGGNFINIGLYNLQNFYAGIQYIPISITIAMLLLHCLPATKEDLGIAGRTLKTALVGLSITSILTLFCIVTPNLVRNAATGFAVLPGQPLSVPVFGVEKHLASIKELGSSCHINHTADHLVIDHMTYFAYLQSRSPIHVLYVSELGYGSDLTNGRLLPFLKKSNSPGIITRCEWMPVEFRNHQKRNAHGYCCADFETE